MAVNNKKSILPFLNILRKLSSEDRVIILAHLDDQTKDIIYKTVNFVLRNKTLPIADRILLKKKLFPYKKDLRYVSQRNIGGGGGKSSRLFRIGGEPLGAVLDKAVPLLLNLFST